MIATSLDSRIFQLTPNLAIDWGYNLFLADSSDTGKETQASAAAALREMEEFVHSFPMSSRERLYLCALRQTAGEFANGMASHKRALKKGLQAAEEQEEKFLKTYSTDLRRGGYVAAALKLLLVGGTAYVLMALLLNSFSVNLQQDHAHDKNFISLATALAVGLTGAWIKGWWQSRRVRGALNKFRETSHSLHEWYGQKKLDEYRLAADTSSRAWQQLTHLQAPTTRAFEALLCDRPNGDSANEVVVDVNKPLSDAPAVPATV